MPFESDGFEGVINERLAQLFVHLLLFAGVCTGCNLAFGFITALPGFR